MSDGTPRGCSPSAATGSTSRSSGRRTARTARAGRGPPGRRAPWSASSAARGPLRQEDRVEDVVPRLDLVPLEDPVVVQLLRELGVREHVRTVRDRLEDLLVGTL